MKLEIDGLKKSFEGHVVLDNLSLDVDDVGCLAVIGPSGGGKSTLLRIIAGLEYPDAGTVALNGKTIVYQQTVLREHRAQLGIVFQAYNLFPHLTALANITLPMIRVHGMKRHAAQKRALKLLKRFNLDAHARKLPSKLSGGQRQRVAIVRALAAHPSVFLFDEPTSALDPEMTAEVLDIIAEIKSQRRHLLVVTHEIGFARRVADHVLLLGEGRILESGPPAKVFDNPQTEQAKHFLAKVLKY